MEGLIPNIVTPEICEFSPVNDQIVLQLTALQRETGGPYASRLKDAES